MSKKFCMEIMNCRTVCSCCTFNSSSQSDVLELKGRKSHFKYSRSIGYGDFLGTTVYDHVFYKSTKLNFSEKSECQTIEKSEKKCCSIDDINNNNLVFPGELG